MKSKGIKKGDLVRVTGADGQTRIVKVDKANQKSITGDSYEFEKTNAKGNFSTYKVKEKSITVDRETVQKIDGQLMSNDLRVKVDQAQLKDEENKSEESEEEIITTRRKKRTRNESSSTEKNPSVERKFKKTEDGRRAVAKKTQQSEEIGGLKVVKKRNKSATVNDPELTQKQQLKIEKDKIKEEKKKTRERKKRLKEIVPNKNIEEIDRNIILSPSTSKKESNFPLEGCSKFSDNRKFLYLYFQNNKKSRAELERLISKDSSLSSPFQNYSTDIEYNLMDYAVKDNDTELIKLLLKENDRISNGESKRPTLPTSSLSNVGTGVFNKYQFGFFTRPVLLGRGGKEGNNAFTHDNKLITNHHYSDLQLLLELDLSYEALKCFILHGNFQESSLYDSIWTIVRRGNIDLLKSKLKKDGPTLLQRLVDNMGYGFNRYHYLALEKDVEGRINKFSMIKKPHTNKGISPLHVACINPDIAVLRKFYTANPDISVADMDQRKLIHYAAANKSDVALNFLVSKGANMNDKDMRGTTPLMIACELGRVENVQFLLKEQKKLLENLDPNDEDYLLMKKTADIVNTYGPSHQFPIHYAINSGSVECVKILVESAGNDIDLNASTTDGKSPISLACALGHYEIAKYLLSKGVSVHESKKQKKNPLIWASQNGHIHIVSLLLRYGIHPDTPDSSGNTAAHYAAGYGWINVLKFLIDNGAHPDLKNDWNSTPAMIAMLKNHFGCLDYLMGLENVDKSMVDNEGRSVISQLCMGFTKDTINQIKYMDKFKSIDYNLKDANGWTCMHFLAANEIQQHKITSEINQLLAEEKSKLEKKLGRSLSADNAGSGGPRRKKVAMKAISARPMKIAAFKSPFGGNRPSKAAANIFNNSFTMAVDEEEKEENITTFKTYYDCYDIKHRKLFRKVRDEYEDSIIECAKYLISKGVKEDCFTYNGLSALRLAVDNCNTRFACWLIDNFSDIKQDHFAIDESNQNATVFLSHMSSMYTEVDWEPLIKKIIKGCSKESIHNLLSYKSYGNITLINFVKSKPNCGYGANDKITAYEEERYIKHLDLILEMAKVCDYDVGAQTSYNKQYCYNYPGITQEKLDKFFEAPNTKMLDGRVSEFGLIDISLKESDYVYLEPGCQLQTWYMNDTKQNMLHALIKQTQNEDDICE